MSIEPFITVAIIAVTLIMVLIILKLVEKITNAITES